MTGTPQTHPAAAEATFELAPPSKAAAERPPADDATSLSEQMLLRNALWFCQLRWIVVAIMVALSLAGWVLTRVDVTHVFRLRPDWPIATAAILIATNLAFLAHARAMKRRGQRLRDVQVNLWSQIVLDLVVLTVVVHFVGSTTTYVTFAYLFHIVLACIFFSRTHSLAVTALAAALYGTCILLEQAGVVGPSSILPEAVAAGRSLAAVDFVSAVVIWLVVWYLTACLSVMVRRRESQCASANVRLREAQEERARHMLRTTHELKAPFAAIHANAQLLLKGHCGELPDEATTVVLRVTQRCRRLTQEIQDMLQLANLQSASQGAAQPAALDLAELCRWAIGQLEPLAGERGVTIRADLAAAPVVCVEDHVKMLLQNLLANAVSYSYQGGEVRIECGAGPDGPYVVVADEGIGIPADKLPRIFEEHYRTKEAVRHNRESSGLGLAIVRQVAGMHGIRVRVTSRPDAGTTFRLSFPAPDPAGADVQLR